MQYVKIVKGEVPEYLTKGKVYEAMQYYNGIYEITDDENDIISIVTDDTCTCLGRIDGWRFCDKDGELI